MTKRYPRNVYTTLENVRSFLSLASGETTDDEHLKDFIRTSSRAIDNFTKRVFYPLRKTRHYSYPQDPGMLRFDEDLVEVMGLSDHNGASEVDSSVYWTSQGADWDDTPYDRIILDDSSGSLFNFTGTDQRAIYLDGIWSYREEYDDYGWVDSGATLTASLGSANTTASVSGSAGRNTLGQTPRFAPLQIWKIDNEFIHANTNNNASSFDIQRGVNGTTAASHASGTTIYTWNPEDDIEYAARQLTAFQYMQATSPRTGQVVVPVLGGMGFEVYDSESWPPSVRALLEKYKKRRVYSF